MHTQTGRQKALELATVLVSIKMHLCCTHTHTHTHTCIHIGICAGEEYDDDKVYMESTQQYIRSEARRSTLRLHSLLRYVHPWS